MVNSELPELPKIDGIIFRPIPGFRCYCINSIGNVWTVLVDKNTVGNKWSQIRVTCEDRYPALWLISDNRKSVKRCIHHLMLMIFVGPRPNGMLALHKDDNPKNNNIDNLRWGTRRDNWLDCRNNGLAPVGEKAKNSVLTDKQVKMIRDLLLDKFSVRHIAMIFNTSQGAISRISNGKGWKHLV